jgi:ornithine cyclodeaminase/alanine dehydrogenase-like protein (mu-crystallin family)
VARSHLTAPRTVRDIERVVVVADLASALDRSGEVCVPIADGVMTASDIHADLGQLVCGTRPGRTSDDEITLFDSVGLALQDIAAAHTVLARARAEGVGTDLDIHQGGTADEVTTS